MDTIPFIFILITLSTASLIENEHDKNFYTTNKFRKKRQTGYLYEKPNISFDLPSTPTITPGTTERPVVNQMQMYYAYPVPSTVKNNVGQLNSNTNLGTQSVTTTVKSGYSYENQNQQSNTSGGNAVSNEYANVGNQISESGYYDGRQRSASSTARENSSQNNNNFEYSYRNPNSFKGDTSSTTQAGYSYEVQSSDAGQAASKLENIGSSTGDNNSMPQGYYSVNPNTRDDTIPVSENTANGVLETSSMGISDGYNFQNAGINRAEVNVDLQTINDGNVGGYSYEKQEISGIRSSFPVLSTSNNYNVQPMEISKINNNIKSGYSNAANSGISGYTTHQNINRLSQSKDYGGDSGYRYERQNVADVQLVNKQQEINVSTSAPTYLPPIQVVNKPSESYLPPQIKETSAPQTLIGQTSAATTNSPFLPKPSLSYLTSAMTNPTEVSRLKPNKVETIQMSVEYIPPDLSSAKSPISNRAYISPNNNVNQVPNQSLGASGTNGHQYLPPTLSYSTTVTPPASTYLPPV